MTTYMCGTEPSSVEMTKDLTMKWVIKVREDVVR